MGYSGRWLRAGVAASLAAFLAVSAACGGASGGEALDVAGAYTLTYAKVGGSCTGNAQNPDFVQGILVITQNGQNVTFDFGQGMSVPGTVDGDGEYAFDGDLTDTNGLLHVQGAGMFTTTGLQAAQGEQGIRAQYDTDASGTADCVTYGTYAGNKTVGTNFT